MANEKINAELLTDEELDGVAGGNSVQTAYDKNLFKVLGVTGNNLTEIFGRYGVTFGENKKGDNIYTFGGREIDQIVAHKIVQLKTDGCNIVSAEGNQVLYNPPDKDVVRIYTF